jgi:hypothetical protein
MLLMEDLLYVRCGLERFILTFPSLTDFDVCRSVNGADSSVSVSESSPSASRLRLDGSPSESCTGRFFPDEEVSPLVPFSFELCSGVFNTVSSSAV